MPKSPASLQSSNKAVGFESSSSWLISNVKIIKGIMVKP
jgi:hypothetical protein